MKPEVRVLLTEWLNVNASVKRQDQTIASCQDAREDLVDKMYGITIKLEDLLFNLDEPLGLRLGDEYIVVVQDPRDDSFVIQTIDFDLRERIKES